jgi:O-antigen/teichoic acid export membrane protein
MTIERIKFLSKDILYYGVGNSVYALVQFICMPIIIRGMSMGEVANWNLLLPTGALLSAFITFGMDSAIVRFVIDKEGPEKKVIFSTGFYFVMALAFFVSLSLWALSSKVMHLINFSTVYTASYWILLCWLPGVILCQFLQNWLKYTFKRTRFISVITLQSFLYFICIICLKLAGKISFQNVMLVSLVSIWLPALLGLFYSYRMIVFKINKEILSGLLGYGAPFMIMAFGFNMIFSIDKYILSGIVTQEQFAVYSQAFRIAAIFSMIVSSFNFAFGPLSLSMLNKEEASQVFASLRTYYLLFICFAGIVFTAAGKPIIQLLSGKDYIGGYSFLTFFIIGYIFYGLFSFAQLGIIRSKKSYLGLYVLCAGLIMTIGSDILLVQHAKGYGTAIGFFLGNLTMFIMAAALSKKYLAVGYQHIKDIIVIMLFAAFGAVSPFIFFADNLYIEALIKMMIGIGLFCAVFMTPLFKTDRGLFRQVLSGHRSAGRVLPQGQL